MRTDIRIKQAVVIHDLISQICKRYGTVSRTADRLIYAAGNRIEILIHFLNREREFSRFHITARQFLRTGYRKRSLSSIGVVKHRSVRRCLVLAARISRT